MYRILLMQCLLLTYCGVFKLFTEWQESSEKRSDHRRQSKMTEELSENQQSAAGPVELHLDISVSVDHQLGAAAEDENLSSVTTAQPTACVSGMNHAHSDSEEAVPPPTQCRAR